MTYQEKKVWTSMFAGLAVFFMYLRRAVLAYRLDGDIIFEDTGFWARTMLLYIGIGVIVIIVLMIILHILMAVSEEVTKKIKEAQGVEVEDDNDYFDVEDEMDRLIGLKAGQIGYIIIGIGFIFGLISLAMNMAPGIMLNMMYLSFMLGSLLEGAVKLYFYKRGVSHG